MSFRPGPLRAGAALAAGFVVVRVVYRVLFHGADGSGPVVLPLPALQLPPPFAHVVMFGPATLGGIADAALSALPIALTILAFGLLNSLFDVSRLFARASRRGPFRGIARALAIAWATLPSLADAVRSARFAQRLRGERGGPRLLSPILERTLERATAVAAALELRGFAGRGLGGECEHPVEMRDAALGHGASPVVRIDDVSLGTGSLVLLSGPTGSGKSTLLRALAGLHTHVDGGWVTGSLRVVGHDRAAVPPRDTARTVGVVLQHPRDAFATDLVADEIGLALELRGVAPVIREARVHEVAGRVGILPLLDRRLRGLSAGEATLVAIAAAIVEQPILLLVDEPLADLDAEFRVRITALLGALAHDAGMCVVVAEHRAAAFGGVADRTLRIEAGLASDGSGGRSAAVVERHAASRAQELSAAQDDPRDSLLSCGDLLPQDSQDAARPIPPRTAPRPQAGSSVLAVGGLTVRHGDAVAVRDASLTLHAGEIVALSGHNGAGKSSLLAAVALPARDTAITVEGRPVRRGDIALVPDASDDLFTCDTVLAECRRAERRTNRPGAASARFAELISLDPGGAGFAARLAQHPRDLSVGERRCLAIALQTLAEPRILLVDEPTRGLDAAASALVARALAQHAAEGGAVLVATHDADFTAGLADRIIPMADGCLGEPSPVGRSRFDSLRSLNDRDDAEPNADSLRSLNGRDEVRPSDDRAVDPEQPRFDSLRSLNGRDDAEPGAGNRPLSEERSDESKRPRPSRSAAREASRPALAALALANVAALAAFLWPLVANALPTQAHAAVPYIALGLAPLAVLVVLSLLDGTVRSAHTLALLGTLAAIGAAIRIAGTGVGGVEALFVLLILAGRAYGARFGLLLGALSIAISAVLAGGIGPWTPFQMFACAWVGAGAGLLPRRVSRWAEIAMLCLYGILSSYVFGLIMNMWFWPFAVGADTAISYVPGGSIGENLASFLVYSLLTSTVTWDTLRAVTTVIGLVVVGRPVLAALRRSKPVTSATSDAFPARAERRTVVHTP